MWLSHSVSTGYPQGKALCPTGYLSSITAKEINSVSASILTTILLLTCLNVACVVVCWRQGSALTSLKTRCRQAIDSVENFESAIDEQRKKINSLSKKFHLEERRDPETGKSRSRDEEDDDPVVRKAALRRKHGLAGLTHAEIARRAMTPGV